jgi:hypothetical protein
VIIKSLIDVKLVRQWIEDFPVIHCQIFSFIFTFAVGNKRISVLHLVFVEQIHERICAHIYCQVLKQSGSQVVR